MNINMSSQKMQKLLNLNYASKILVLMSVMSVPAMQANAGTTFSIPRDSDTHTYNSNHNPDAYATWNLQMPEEVARYAVDSEQAGGVRDPSRYAFNNPLAGTASEALAMDPKTWATFLNGVMMKTYSAFFARLEARLHAQFPNAPAPDFSAVLKDTAATLPMLASGASAAALNARFDPNLTYAGKMAFPIVSGVGPAVLTPFRVGFSVYLRYIFENKYKVPTAVAGTLAWGGSQVLSAAVVTGGQYATLKYFVPVVEKQNNDRRNLLFAYNSSLSVWQSSLAKSNQCLRTNNNSYKACSLYTSAVGPAGDKLFQNTMNLSIYDLTAEERLDTPPTLATRPLPDISSEQYSSLAKIDALKLFDNIATMANTCIPWPVVKNGKQTGAWYIGCQSFRSPDVEEVLYIDTTKPLPNGNFLFLNVEKDTGRRTETTSSFVGPITGTDNYLYTLPQYRLDSIKSY